MPSLGAAQCPPVRCVWRTGGSSTSEGLRAPPPTSPLHYRSLAQSLWALFTSSLAISLVFAIIPFCSNVKVLASVMALAGLAMGCIDTVANMQLVRIYQKDSAVFLQVTPQRAWGCVAGRALCICPPLPSHTPRGSLSWPLGQGGDAERALASQFS